ncbi:hypothetical protein COO60DRAFT_1700352 [Scenedesmus sp. NREL 46B-D3]|nr:hypothetical protein COO60DRAFT_1700352 [Scenedesmus sp. NREL 46B-D3]
MYRKQLAAESMRAHATVQHPRSITARPAALSRPAAPHMQQHPQQRSKVAPRRHSRQHVRTFVAASSITPSSGSTNSSSSSSGSLNRGPVLVVPAFYLDAQAFKPLVQELRSRGFNAALPPIRWTDWVPTLGGRSVRPILDRMDYALTQLLEGYQVSEQGGYEVPLPQPATYQDWLQEMRDASQGARPGLQLTGPWQGQERAALVASSAGGWISRIFLARGPPYSGTVYHGADRVHTLVTLGTPHKSAEPVTRKNIDFVNDNYGGAHMHDVRYVAIGSKTVQGKSWLNGSVQDFAYQSYNICIGDGNAWGDGVTPLECALALDGAHHIVMEGARHVPLEVKPEQDVHWYGSGPYLEQWVHWLQHDGSSQAAAAQAAAESSGGDGSNSSSSSGQLA